MKKVFSAAIFSLAIASVALGDTPAAQSEPERVRLQPREKTGFEAWSLIGFWKPGSIPDCTSEPCKRTNLGTLGGSQWFWIRSSEFEDFEQGELMERTPSGEAQTVWGVEVDASLAVVTDAEVLRRNDRTFLHVQVFYDGTGSFRDDFLFEWTEGYWQEVDTRAWRKDLKLPPCYGLWKGPFIDFDTFKLEMGVWIAGDGNCCPTGGTLKVEFDVRDNALVIAKFEHLRTEEDGNPWEAWRKNDESRCGPKPKGAPARPSDP